MAAFRSSSTFMVPTAIVAADGERGLTALRHHRNRVRPWLVALGTLVVATSGAVFLMHDSAEVPFSITVLAPVNGSAITPGATTISVQLSSVRWRDGRSSQGLHLHYYLDVDPPTAPDRPAVTRLGTWASSDLTFHVWNVVGAGTHKLSVELVRGDDTPLVPAVTASVLVQIPSVGGAPTSSSGQPLQKPASAGGGC
jgi:hypothetical protein